VGQAVIEVPAMAGEPGHEAAAGPAALSGALAEAGYELATHRLAVPRFAGDNRAASLKIARRLAQRVREVVGHGDLPLVLAGSCDIAPGVLAGIRDPEAGVVWIDAHADFNTPDSSASGFWPGMALAVVVGDCGDEVWSALDWSPVPAERVALLGTRSLSPAEEARRLARSGMRVVGWRNGAPQQNLGAVLESLAAHIDRVYVHLDLDALDPAIGSGVVDPPVAGGLSERQLTEVLDDIGRRFSLAAASVTTYTPAKDDGSTLPAALSALRALIRARAEG
jgi:arginase